MQKISINLIFKSKYYMGGTSFINEIFQIQVK